MTHVLLGGSGTLGTALIERLVLQDQKVVCFSRGEHAQKRLKARFPSVQTVVGDIRDYGALSEAVRDASVVYLLAAIKHVDVAQENPIEAVKTNVLGAMNIARAAIKGRVPYVVYSNTDKAVLPITTYGYTKALAQDLLLSQNRRSLTRFSAFNWGNIVASQGSAIPIFVDSMVRTGVVPITDPRMSRFWLTIDQAADFILKNYRQAPPDRALVPPVKGATIVRVIESIARILGITSYRIETIGHRGVEKLYEVLESTHERCLRSDTCEQYSNAELDMLLRPVVVKLGKEAARAA